MASTIRPSGILSSLKSAHFRVYSVSNAFAAVDMNVRIAVHGWLVLELSGGSEMWVGISALFLGIGQLIFSMIAGAIADRFQRRTVLLFETSSSLLVSAILAFGTYYSVVELWHAIAVTIIIGSQRAVRFTAANRFVYDLVGPHQLVNGIALWRLSAAPMMILGATTAGVLIDEQGIWAAYAFIAISLAFSLPFLVWTQAKGQVERGSTSLVEQTLEGIRFAWRYRPLRILLSFSIVMESLGFAFLIMIPVMAKNVLEVGGTGMGFLQSGVGIGMLFASIVMATYGDSQEKPRVIFWGALGAGIAMIGFALSQSLILSTFLAAGVMGFLNAYDLTIGALMQLTAPANLRGRAVSLHSLAISFTALGGFGMGVLGGLITVPPVLASAGGGIIANALWRRRAIIAIAEDRGNQQNIGAKHRNDET